MKGKMLLNLDSEDEGEFFHRLTEERYRAMIECEYEHEFPKKAKHIKLL
jgi:hypothetical protein